MLPLNRGKGVAAIAVSHFPEKGGDAYGRRAMDESPSFRGMLHHRACIDDLHIPKRKLTARSVPERSTILKLYLKG